MKNFILPDDPLLDKAAALSPDSDHGSPEPHAEWPHGEDCESHGNEGEQPEHPDLHQSGEETNAPSVHKRPRLENHGDQRIVDNGNQGHIGIFTPGGNMPAPLVQPSLRQFVPSIVSSKKLRDHSAQELYRFASASGPEREAMAFAVNLEMRDTLDSISNAVTSTSVHPDLRKHIKTYTGCLFFSPNLPYYSGTRGGSRSKELQKTNMLKACQVPNIPPPDNHVATKSILSIIGGDLIDYWSFAKTELAKRKPGAANMDLGTFVANLIRNTNIKATKEHYGRVAFLSREYRRWDSRDKTKADLTNVSLWDWVDAALANARKKYGNQPEAINKFFQTIIDEDERLFQKAIGTVARPEERENWQRQVEMASNALPAITNN